MRGKLNISYVSTLVLVIMLVSSMFAIHLIAPAVASTPAISLSKTTVTVGEKILITGTGLKPGTEYSLKFGDLSLVLDTQLSNPSIKASTDYDVKTDANGNFWIQFTVPDIQWSVEEAKRKITVHEGKQSLEGVAVATSTALTIMPKIGIYDSSGLVPISSGYVGGTITIKVSGFKKEDLSVKIDTTSMGSISINDYGSGQGTFTIPEIPRGTHTIRVYGATSGNEATATFTVLPKIKITSDGSTETISMDQATASSIYIEGKGFDANITIPANSIKIGPVTAVHPAITVDEKGSFPATAIVANVITLQGVYNITVGDIVFPNAIIVSSDGLIPMLQLSKTSAKVGDPITVYGSGFSAEEDNILIELDASAKGFHGSARCFYRDETTKIDATNKMLSQAFVAMWKDIKTVRLLIKKTGSPGDITVKIYATDIDQKPTGSVLGTVTISVSSVGTLGLISASFTTAVTVTPGSVYALVISAASADTTNYYEFGQASGDKYPDGKLYSGDGTTWTEEVNKDLTFEVRGNILYPISGQKPSAGTLDAWSSLSVKADARGAFIAILTVPHVSMGSHTIDVEALSDALIVDPDRELADTPVSTGFSISPQIITSALTLMGKPGDTRPLEIAGFKAGETVTVTVYGTTLKTCVPDSFGYASISIPYPGSMPGPTQPLTVAGTTSGNTASITFSVTPDVDINPDSGTIGTLITISGKGLKASTTYVVRWGGASLGSSIFTFTTEPDGDIPPLKRFAIPSGSLRGANIVDLAEAATPTTSVVYGISSTLYAATGFKTISVGGRIAVSPTAGYVGDVVTVTGEGLEPGTEYTISYGLTAVATFKATSQGTVPPGVTFVIPPSTSGAKAGVTKDISISPPHADPIVFVLLPKASISPTSGVAGNITAVTLTGSGLAGSTAYYVILLEKLPLSDENPGTILTQFTSESDGDVPPGVTFVIPLDLPAGTYYIDLAATGAPTTSILPTVPRFTLTLPTPPVLGTDTFTPSDPKLLDSAGRPVTSVPRGTAFYTQINVTSNVGVDLSVYVISQIKDSTGKVVALGLTAADVRAGATKSVPVAFLGIATPGTYTVTVYVWSSVTEPTPLAPTTTFAITIT